MPRPRLPLAELIAGVRAGNRSVLAQAITLVESELPADREVAQQLLEALLPATGRAIRVGVSGAPGVGKSTLLEALGMLLVEAGQRVAVLAIDPSSRVHGGSILGDKSRMPSLAQHPSAFIRPSPAGSTLGGVTRRTRETALLCEAAAFDVVVVETVGVGQSETAVVDLVDSFLVLLEPGAGDELQGIKRGILELADIVAVTKADGESLARARASQREYAAALRYLAPAETGWAPVVTTVSARDGAGIPELWQLVLAHRTALGAERLAQRRQTQQVRWFWAELEAGVREVLTSTARRRERLLAVQAEVAAGRSSPTAAARRFLLELGVGVADGA